MEDPVAEPRPAGIEAAVGLAQAAQPGEQVGTVLGPAKRHRVPMDQPVNMHEWAASVQGEAEFEATWERNWRWTASHSSVGQGEKL